jgi:hypothetical protein
MHPGRQAHCLLAEHFHQGWRRVQTGYRGHPYNSVHPSRLQVQLLLEKLGLLS